MGQPPSEPDVPAVVRFVVRGEAESWRAALVGSKAIRDRIGTPLVAAFLKCFVGLDRLLTLEHLLVLSLPLAEDSAPRRRNVRAAATLLSSTLVELGEALQDLCDARIDLAVSDASVWAPLNKKRRLWRSDIRLRAVRNGMGSHLGEISAYRVGLDALVEENDELVFATGSGPRRHDDEHVLGWNALFRGTKTQDDELRHVVELTHTGHTELPEELYAAWRDVLARAGVQFERDEPSPDRG